ncbi:MAG: Ethanolamine utilization protein EutN/carboxysome structural protein Ccml [Klenkia sp.]|nr:Ethanolamine utilization protein EutN/carboxysome structural protein Ccml [Klenkia sp.]
MQLAEVLGQVVATVKQPGLASVTLLLVQDVPDGDVTRTDRPTSYVAVDAVGAGVGELVLVVAGAAARIAAGSQMPTDRAVVAIADTVIRSGDVVYRK